MLSRCSQMLLVSFLVCIVSVNVLGGTSPDANGATTGRRGRDPTAEERTLAIMGLKKDITDAEIIALLDKPATSVHAAALIGYRRISAAIPDLLRIVQDDKRLVPERFGCASTLCNLGNKEWVPAIKKLSADPNGMLRRVYGADVAGLLARVGDYSQLSVVASQLKDEEGRTSYGALRALSYFAHESDPAAVSAADLLYSVARSDSSSFAREYAMRSLETIAQKRPALKTRLIDAAKTNAGSSDVGLRGTSQAMLKKYAPETGRINM